MMSEADRNFVKLEDARRAHANRGRGDLDQLRTDIHRRGAFVPESYEFFGSYIIANVWSDEKKKWIRDDSVCFIEGQAQKYFTTEDEYGVQPVEYEAMTYGDFGSCAVCGNWYSFGEVWRHRESYDLIHIGHDCCAKYRFVSGTNWSAVQDERRRAQSKQRAIHMRRLNQAASLAKWSDLAELLAMDHYVARSVNHYTWNKTGLITEEQVTKLRTLKAELAAQRARDAQRLSRYDSEKKVAAPTGDDVEVEGKIVSIKDHETPWGNQPKMTVKVTTPHGVWLCWSTRPIAIKDAKVGDVVKFRASLKAGRDPFFVFACRPTRALIAQSA